jgi:predicted NBD/HSP70 family sugar kinase
VLFIQIGTEIGGGIIAGGRLYREIAGNSRCRRQ